MSKVAEKKILSFSSQTLFRTWLSKNHASTDELWVRLYKKASEVKSINYAEALDEALCFGWIDAKKISFDEESWLQRFCPRRAGSIWSKINITHVERLTKLKKMKPAGLREVKAAKDDGRWAKAYDSSKNSEVPEDFLKALSKRKKALAFFKTLSRANLYAITYRLQTAKKPETREKRMNLILEMLDREETFH